MSTAAAPKSSNKSEENGTKPALGVSKELTVKEQLNRHNDIVQGILRRMTQGSDVMEDAENLLMQKKAIAALKSEQEKVREQHTEVLVAAGLEPHDVYPKEAIAASYAFYFPKSDTAPTSQPRSAKATDGATRTRAKKDTSSGVLFRAKAARGSDATWAKGQKVPPVGSSSFIQNYRGKTMEQTAEKLRASADESVLKYIDDASAGGPEEFKNIVKWVHEANPQKSNAAKAASK